MRPLLLSNSHVPRVYCSKAVLGRAYCSTPFVISRSSLRLAAKNLGSCRPIQATAGADASAYQWTGTDEFTVLEDRKDLPPQPLPAPQKSLRIALVRHGQSTWNAEGRIQGSTNFAVLTEKGMSQAETTQKLLENDNFDVLFHSPLERASRTAEIVWGDREGPVVVLPSLREIDLYSFQGLLKDEGMARYGEQFKAWQKHASKFEIDGHAPVRELWYRGSLVWREVLRLPTPYSTALVVAHNAVNQAILCTALGLPPTYFRRILQSNGATSVLDLSPGSPPRVTVDRLNQSPGSPLLAGAGRKTAARIVLVRHAATFSTEDGLMLGTMDEECSPLGEVHSQKIGELLMDSEVGRLFSSPLARARTTAAVVTKYQKLAGNREPRIETMEELLPPDAGDFTGMRLRDIRDRGGLESPPEEMEAFWQRTREAWAALLRAADGNGGQPVVAVAHASVIAALLCHCLDLPENKLSIFRTDPGGITIIDFPDGAEDGRGVIRCSNYTSHLGRWAVPITPESLDLVCGVDGCF